MGYHARNETQQSNDVLGTSNVANYVVVARMAHVNSQAAFFLKEGAVVLE